MRVPAPGMIRHSTPPYGVCGEPKRPAPPPPEPLTPLVDAHTHLDACGAEDADDVRAIVDRAAAVGVEAVVTIADDLDSARWVTDAADWDPRVYAAVALHPTRANALNDEAKTVIERLARPSPRRGDRGDRDGHVLAGQARRLRRPRASSARPSPGTSTLPSGPASR